MRLPHIPFAAPSTPAPAAATPAKSRTRDEINHLGRRPLPGTPEYFSVMVRHGYIFGKRHISIDSPTKLHWSRPELPPRVKPGPLPRKSTTSWSQAQAQVS